MCLLLRIFHVPFSSQNFGFKHHIFLSSKRSFFMLHLDRSFSWGSPVTQLFPNLPAISPALSISSSLCYLTLLTTFSLKFYPTLALLYHSVLIFIILSWDFFSLFCPLHVDIPQSSLPGFCLFNSNSLSCVILTKTLIQWFVLSWPPYLFL